MDEPQQPAGEGSSVDDVGEGNQSTDDPTSGFSDQSKRKKVLEAAASDSKYPNGGNHQGEFGEEMQVSVDQEKQKVLENLNNVMSDLFKDPVDAELLEVCIDKSSISPEILLQFFQNYSDQHKKSGKGGKNLDRSVGSSHKAKSSSSSTHSWYMATVRVFPVITGQTCGAHHAILEKVNKSTAVETTRDWQDCDIIMVFCPITCRVGSDVEAAMRDIPVGKPSILVLMHHTRDVDYSTDVKKWSEDYKNVVLDVHVLFHETLQGLLKCSKNDQATQQIQKVLKKYSKRNVMGWNLPLGF